MCFQKTEPVGFADSLDLACERKRKGIKDNAKDFGLSLWGMMLLFTQRGQGCKWSKFGKGTEFGFR